MDPENLRRARIMSLFTIINKIMFMFMFIPFHLIVNHSEQKKNRVVKQLKVVSFSLLKTY